MFEVRQLDQQMIEIYSEGECTYKDWIEYQELVLEQLNLANHKLYILSNLSELTSFESKIVKEVGTAKHLTHPNLGFIVMVGGNKLMNFLLQVTENRAQQERSHERMRVLKNYDKALQTLNQQREMANPSLI